ncbi:MAG: winged helix-turn-helix domain-containing protein [Verrucomicrobiae bacterium]|nr:winged helix-turn-helix domain-containing protein [Verrucomicrobiae bacterium]
MNKSPKALRDEFSQAVLNFIWSQWGQVGVHTSTNLKSGPLFDPEPLVLLSLACGRNDPRLFDAVLDWLRVNGRWMNVTRLRTLAGGLKTNFQMSLLGAVAATMTEHDVTAKWTAMAKDLKPGKVEKTESVFPKLGDLAVVRQKDPVFAEYGWSRSPWVFSEKAQALDFSNPVALMLKCRAFFGVTMRADIFARLLLRESLSVTELARGLGYSQRRVYEALTEMATSEVIRIMKDGARNEYSVNMMAGWKLMYQGMPEDEGMTKPQVFDWCRFARGMIFIWNKLFSLNLEATPMEDFNLGMFAVCEESKKEFGSTAPEGTDRRIEPSVFLREMMNCLTLGTPPRKKPKSFSYALDRPDREGPRHASRIGA